MDENQTSVMKEAFMGENSQLKYFYSNILCVHCSPFETFYCIGYAAGEKLEKIIKII